MSTYHHEFMLADVAEADVLRVMVERAEDPRLGEFWADLLQKRPGTANYIIQTCREKAGDNLELYEKLFVTALEMALTLGEAAVRNSMRVAANPGVTVGDESVPLQAEPRDDR